jgi:hypothetical protein
MGPNTVVIVTVAVPVIVASATDFALTVTAAGLGTVAGAVYFPLVSIVPQLAPEQPDPEALQVTAGFAPLGVTVAWNFWTPPVRTGVLEGNMVTPEGGVVMGVGVGGGLLFVAPPHPARNTRLTVPTIASFTLADTFM